METADPGSQPHYVGDARPLAGTVRGPGPGPPDPCGELHRSLPRSLPRFLHPFVSLDRPGIAGGSPACRASVAIGKQAGAMVRAGIEEGSMAVRARLHPGMPVVAVAGLIGAAMPAQARPAWASGTFVYADLCTETGGGGRAGRRITLRRSPNGDALTYEGASARAPLPVATMRLDPETRALAFTVETEDRIIAFRGTLAVDALTGTVEDEAGPRPVRLPRVLRSHAHEACRGEAGDVTGSIAGAR